MFSVRTLKRQKSNRFIRNKLAVVCLFILAALILASILAPFIAPYSFDRTDLLARKKPPSEKHWLGTDSVGRDVFTRLLYGGRISLMVGLSTMILQLFLGTVLGTVAGYCGGWIDMLVSRIADAIMCFPFFLIAMSAVTILGSGIVNLVLIIGFLMWPKLFRIIRTEVQALRENDYITAAKAIGLSTYEVIKIHVIPNILSSVVVAATLSLAKGIILEAALSFLSLGVRPPIASWGNMLSEAQNITALSLYWWMWLPPGLVVTVTVLCINYIGEGLKNVYDPKDD